MQVGKNSHVENDTDAGGRRGVQTGALDTDALAVEQGADVGQEEGR